MLKFTLKYTNLFVIIPATILAIMLGFSTLTVSAFAQSEETNQTMKDAGQSANQTGEEMQKNASDVGSKVTEGAKDVVGKIGEGLENLGK
jgi:hypothetical protein